MYPIADCIHGSTCANLPQCQIIVANVDASKDSARLFVDATGQNKAGATLRAAPAQRALPSSVNEAGAGRLFEGRGQRAIFLAVGAGQSGDPVQVILRRIAVALLDLPQPVILPGLDVVRVGLQRALVPDLRNLVVAELAIGVA